MALSNYTTNTCCAVLFRGSVSAPARVGRAPGIFFDPCPSGDLLGGAILSPLLGTPENAGVT